MTPNAFAESVRALAHKGRYSGIDHRCDCGYVSTGVLLDVAFYCRKCGALWEPGPMLAMKKKTPKPKGTKRTFFKEVISHEYLVSHDRWVNMKNSLAEAATYACPGSILEIVVRKPVK